MSRGRSLAERIAALPPAARAAVLGDSGAEAARAHWRFWARPEQLPPEGDWQLWLLCAGRGFGKTRCGAEWVNECALANPGARIALVGATAADVRAVMVEGASGVLAAARRSGTVRWYAARGELHWPGGAQARLYSAEAHEGLRGPQHHFAWGDEIAKWKDADAALANLRLGLRLGERPRLLLTTTPRPVPVLKALLADPACTVTRGRTGDNRANLPPAYMAAMRAAYGGTRLGRQELNGELVEEPEGALWSQAMLDAARETDASGLVRVVVAVDPPAGATRGGGDACGIIVAGVDAAGVAHVLADASVEDGRPERWSAAVAGAAIAHEADCVVAEANNGGAMVEAVLRAADSALPVKLVRASRGKSARAEPVAQLYARGRVRHAGRFERLEAELAGLIAGGGYEGPGRSPDRADALVWAVSELLLGRRRAPLVRQI